MNTRTDDTTSRPRARRVRVFTSVGAGAPAAAPTASAPANLVTRLRPRPAPAGIGDHLPIAVGFGSDFETTPRMFWVVPGAVADVVPLPELLDQGLLDEGIVTPLRLSPPVTTPQVGPRDRIHLSRPATDRIATGQPVPLRLTARGRTALLLLAGLIGAVVVVFAWFGAGATSAHSNTAVPAQVVVHDGDTLWSIAGRVAPGRDPRAVVDQLRRVNRLRSPNLVPGQVLRTH